MTRSPDLPELSKAELDLMRILWEGEELSAREVHDQLTADGTAYDWAYSTTRTMLERMVKKGYVERRSFHGVMLYVPLLSRPQGLARLVQDFASRVLEMDHSTVVALFARGSKLSPSEVNELARLLNESSE